MHHPTMTDRYPKEMYRRARRFLTLTAELLVDCAEAGLLKIENALVDATLLWSALHGITSLIISQRVDTKLDQTMIIDKAIQRAINSFRASEQAFVI